jgi:multidrug efflux pump subunit AcrA (membrane-fusion protein)
MSIRHPRSFRVVVRTVVSLAVVGAIATAAVAATSSHGSSYRTAIVTRADVDAELHETGTIEPVNQAIVAFPISGTVAAVAVKAGQSTRRRCWPRSPRPRRRSHRAS